MSRLSRKDAAKSVIAVWQWLHARPGAPRVEGTTADLMPDLDVGNVAAGSGLDDRLRLMEYLGLLKREHRHEMVERGGRPVPTLRITNVLLEADVEKGAKRIAQHFARGGFLKVKAKGNQKMNGTVERAVDPEKVAIRTDDKDRPVEAVVGEDAPTLGEGLREAFVAMQTQEKDESAALVAAARQYNSRQEFVIAKLQEMEALGIQLDRGKVLAGVKLQRDDELEGVVKVLPYIDQLEARIKQADGWRQAMLDAKEQAKQSAREVERMAGELRRQQEANQRLAEKMARDVATGTVQPRVLVG